MDELQKEIDAKAVAPRITPLRVAISAARLGVSGIWCSGGVGGSRVSNPLMPLPRVLAAP